MPVAVQVNSTRVPPLADPLHCVMVAPEVVEGNGSHVLAIPSPDALHWLTVMADSPEATPMNSLVTSTLHRSVPPPPFVDALHCEMVVTGALSVSVVVEQEASGSPAAPWHSRTVTLADPPLAVIVLTMVTSQMSPRPGVLSTPLLQVVVGAITAARAGVTSDPVDVSSAIAKRLAMSRRIWRCKATPI